MLLFFELGLVYVILFEVVLVQIIGYRVRVVVGDKVDIFLLIIKMIFFDMEERGDQIWERWFLGVI